MLAGARLVLLCSRMFEALAHVRRQLQFLWSGELVDTLFAPVLALTPAAMESRSSKGEVIVTFFIR